MTEAKNESTDKTEASGPKTTPDGTPVVRTIGRDFRVEGNDVDGYIGVSAEYRTYANETEKPYVTDGEVEAMLASGQLTDAEMLTLQVAGQKQASGVVPSEEDDDEKGDDEDDKSKESASKAAAKQGQGGSPSAPISATEQKSSTKAAATGTSPKAS